MIPGSSNPDHIAENYDIFDFELTDEEMELLKNAERDCRLVKGQVFRWPGATDWTQLWAD